VRATAPTQGLTERALTALALEQQRGRGFAAATPQPQRPLTSPPPATLRRAVMPPPAAAGRDHHPGRVARFVLFAIIGEWRRDRRGGAMSGTASAPPNHFSARPLRPLHPPRGIGS
jgi:hypothetical protein